MPSQTVSSLSDKGHQTRLKLLLTEVSKEVQNRIPLQRMKASIRTFRHTRAVSGRHAGFFVVERSLKITFAVLAVPAIVVATVGTAGILPVGFVITAAAAWGVKRAFSTLNHMLDVNDVLNTLGDFERSPESSGPNLSPNELQKTLLMARNMVDKLISDIDKLSKKEIPKYLDALKKSGVSSLPSDSELIKEVLQMGKFASENATRQHGPLTLLSVTAKSKSAPNAVSLVHLRLQRIQGYLRWIHQLVEGLKLQTLQELAETQELEFNLIQRISLQVHAGGNHAACDGNLCFGPSSDDLVPGPLTQVQVDENIFNAIRNTYSKLTPETFSTIKQQAELAETNDSNRIQKILDLGQKEGSKVTIDDQADQLGESIADFSTSLTGEFASKIFSDLFSDVLKGVVDLTRESVKVNRPLFARVQEVQEALHASGRASVDDEIVKMAEKNDLNAIRRALNKSTYHYPNRVADRATKFKAMCHKLDTRSNTMGQSVFVNCTEAAAALRYLLKVYHNAEKQMIHLHFVSLGIDSLSRKVFGTSAALSTAPQARYVETQLVNPLNAMKAAWVPLKLQREIILNTFISKYDASFTSPSSQMLTDEEWRTMSYAIGFRSELTKRIDQALKSYRESFHLHSAPFAVLRTEMPNEMQLDNLLQHLRARRTNLSATLESAVSNWLKVKEEKEVSQRRASVMNLESMIQREGKALDNMIGAVQVAQVRFTTAEIGLSVSKRWQNQNVSIEAEDD